MVVIITRKQRDFNFEMGAYLDKRTQGNSESSGSFFKKVDSLIPRFKRTVDSSVPDEVDVTESTVYERKKRRSFFSLLFSSSPRQVDDLEEDELLEEVHEEVGETEQELHELEGEVEEIEDYQESVIKKFFTLLRLGRRKKSSNDEYADEIPQEMVDKAMGKDAKREALYAETRAVLKLTHKWISKLSPDQIDAFKRSSDFERYKNLLDEYGLTK